MSEETKAPPAPSASGAGLPLPQLSPDPSSPVEKGLFVGTEGADSNVELLEGVQGSEAGKNEARLEELAGRLSTAFRNAEKGGRDDANMGLSQLNVAENEDSSATAADAKSTGKKGLDIDPEIAEICSKLTEEDLRGILRVRHIESEDCPTRDDLLRRVHETHMHARRGSGTEPTVIQQTALAFVKMNEATKRRKSSFVVNVDLLDPKEYERECDLEMNRLNENASTERCCVRRHLDDVKKHVHRVDKSETLIDQSVLMPEFFSASSNAGAKATIQCRFRLEHVLERENSPNGKAKRREQQKHIYIAGWMEKKGGTTHAFTKDYKKRWFELNPESKILTYFQQEPPEDINRQLVRKGGRRVSEISFERILSLVDSDPNAEGKERAKTDSVTGLTDIEKKEKALEIKRKKLRKGAIDMSVVQLIRPAEVAGCPAHSFELVTGSKDKIIRVWVLAPENKEKQDEWLKALCLLVERSKIHPKYQNYTAKNGNHDDRQKFETVEVDLTDADTVEQVISAAFTKLTAEKKIKMPSERPEEYALKVPKKFDFMTTRKHPLCQYEHVANCLSKGEQAITLELVPPSEIRALLSKMGGSMAEENGGDENPSNEVAGGDEVSSSLLETIKYSIVTKMSGEWVCYKEPKNNQSFFWNRKNGAVQREKPDGFDALQMEENFRDNVLSVEELMKAANKSFDNESFDVSYFGKKFTANGSEFGVIESAKVTREAFDVAHNDVWGGQDNVNFIEASKGSAPAARGKESTEPEERCADDAHRSKLMYQPCLPRRLVRSPVRVRILGLERDNLSSPFYECLRKDGTLVDGTSMLSAVSVRVGFFALGRPLPSGWMETPPIPYIKRKLVNFSATDWIKSKVFMHNMPSTTRAVFQLKGFVKNEKGVEVAVTLASAAVQLSDFNGRMISGKHAIRLWPTKACEPHDIISGPCKAWEFNEPFDDLKHTKSINHPYANNCRLDRLQFKMPTIYVEFDSFRQVVEWPLLYSANPDAIEEDDDPSNIHISKSSWFFLEEPSFIGTKWVKRWFVLSEVAGCLEWFASNTSPQPLGKVFLDDVETAEVEEKSKLQKQGKGSTHKMVKFICISVNTSGSSSSDVKKPKKDRLTDTGKTLYLSGQARYELRTWMDAIAKVGKSRAEGLASGHVQNDTNSTSPVTTQSMIHLTPNTPGTVENYVATNREEWIKVFQGKLKEAKQTLKIFKSTSSGSPRTAKAAKKSTKQDPRNVHSSVASERDIQWEKHADKETVLRVLKTDPLYQLNSAEKATLWTFKEYVKREGFRGLPKLLKSVNWNRSSDVLATMELLPGWQMPEKKQELLQLLDISYQCLPIRKFAVEGIKEMDDSNLAGCLPQLVQALKFDPYDFSELGLLLIERSIMNPLVIGVPFFWCCNVELRHVHCRSRYAMYIHEYKSRCGTQQRVLLERQHMLWAETGLFAKVAFAVYAEKGRGKKQYYKTLHNMLNRIEGSLPPGGFELPFDPRVRVLKPKIDQCRVMSSAKLPLWLTFENADPQGDDVMIMFKAGDDLRQDTMVLQLIEVMDSMWRAEGRQLFMSPYKCMSTWYDGGLLEIVLDSVTTAEIHMQYGGKYSGSFDKSTFSKFIAEHNLGQKEYQAAVDRFIKSAAAYCVATYVMGIGDRHNDNIMVKTNGQYFHIDFGHFLGNVKYQFGIKRERTEFVFTPEMAEVMGGTKAEGFKDFKQECADALHILRDNVSTLINLFLLMVPAGMPELASAEDINYLRDQLDTRIAKQEATDRFEKQLSLALGDVVKKIDNAMHIIKHN
jgi:hypothetical protein